MPCGKENCLGCTKCKFDLPLDAPLKNMKIKEICNCGIMPMDGHPATAQIIIPGATMRHHIEPMGATQLSLPFKKEESVEECKYCNVCPHFVKLERPNKNSFNTRCSAETPRPGGSYRVIKLRVFKDEKVEKPFWCPLINKKINEAFSQGGIKIGGRTVYPEKQRTSAMSDEQLNDWNRSKARAEIREKWLAAPGIVGWDDIVEGEIYHVPPSFKKGRMTIKVKKKHISSIFAVDLKTDTNIWFYKDDEEYKFMSPVK